MSQMDKMKSTAILDEQSGLEDLVQGVLDKAKKLGATDAEVGASIDSGFTTTVRMGEVDTVEYNRDKGVGITVYFGQKKGSASTSDTRKEPLESALKAACDIARYTADDPCSGLADKELMAFDYPDLDLYHPWDLSPEQGIDLAKKCEDKARALDKRITNSEGATVATGSGVSVYGNTHGFLGAVKSSRHSLSCVLVGGEGKAMQRDYDYTVAIDPSDLESFSTISKRAVERTVRRLDARRLSTRKSPVIFEANIASGLLSSFVKAICGGNLYRKSSFLCEHLGEVVFPKHILVSENPHVKKGLGSAPFDSEGVVTQKHDIVKEGVLQSYVLGSYSARKLGMQTTGNAGGVHNLEISTSALTLPELIKTMGTGLLVTEVMGQGLNIVTGDYSRGAVGFWVENGEIQYPVEEITIAGNMKDLFANLVNVANDVNLRSNIRTGSILLEEMIIAGE